MYYVGVESLFEFSGGNPSDFLSLLSLPPDRDWYFTRGFVITEFSGIWKPSRPKFPSFGLYVRLFDQLANRSNQSPS